MIRHRTLVALATVLLLAACSTSAEPDAPTVPAFPPNPATPTSYHGPSPATNGQYAVVVDVVDGDTIRVRIDGQTFRVRYIGIDTPELEREGEPAEWMGPEAKSQNEALVVGKNVFLEKDVSDTDRYGRLLRYVWVGRTMVNGEMVRLGYAQAITYPPDVKYQPWLRQLQEEARRESRGLWAAQ